MEAVQDEPKRTAETGQISLIHFGDLHVWRYGLDRDYFPKRLLGLGNLRFKRGSRFPVAVAHQLIERMLKLPADWLAFSGDISTTSLKAEFEAGRRLFEPLFDAYGERFVCIPGNHDRYTKRSSREKLFERHFLQREQNYPLVQDLGQNWSLLGYDCSVPRYVLSTGRITGEMLDQIEARLEELKKQGRRIVVMGHYPLVYPVSIPPSWEHSLSSRRRRALCDLFKQYKVDVYLHGHKHVRWAMKVGETLHLNCGSAGMVGGHPARSPGFLRLILNAEGASEVEAHWIDRTHLAGQSDPWHQRRLPQGDPYTVSPDETT